MWGGRAGGDTSTPPPQSLAFPFTSLQTFNLNAITGTQLPEEVGRKLKSCAKKSIKAANVLSRAIFVSSQQFSCTQDIKSIDEQ